MSHVRAEFEYMSFDDFEEALADKPRSERWELIGGRVVRLMVGARWEHNFLVQNVSSGLRDRLRAAGSPCRTLTETFYLKDPKLEAALLPDVIVHCGKLAAGATSVDDPTVLVEVLSIGAEARDRFEKWDVYQRIPTLRHYVLVRRDRPHIEAYDRPDRDWTGLRVVEGLDAVLPLPALGIEVPLREIYRDVIDA
jgi:Uma2 family endonuclease